MSSLSILGFGRMDEGFSARGCQPCRRFSCPLRADPVPSRNGFVCLL